MAVTFAKQWADNELLRFDDLNAEFDNIYSLQQSLGFPATAAKKMNTFELTLDSAESSGISAASNNIIDFRLGTAKVFRWDGTAGSVDLGILWTATAAGGTPSIVPRSAGGGSTNVSVNLAGIGTGGPQLDGFRAFGANDERNIAQSMFSRGI